MQFKKDRYELPNFCFKRRNVLPESTDGRDGCILINGVSPCTAVVQKNNKSYMHGSFFRDTLSCIYAVIT